MFNKVCSYTRNNLVNYNKDEQYIRKIVCIKLHVLFGCLQYCSFYNFFY